MLTRELTMLLVTNGTTRVTIQDLIDIVFQAYLSIVKNYDL